MNTVVALMCNGCNKLDSFKTLEKMTNEEYIVFKNSGVHKNKKIKEFKNGTFTKEAPNFCNCN